MILLVILVAAVQYGQSDHVISRHPHYRSRLSYMDVSQPIKDGQFSHSKYGFERLTFWNRTETGLRSPG